MNATRVSRSARLWRLFKKTGPATLASRTVALLILSTSPVTAYEQPCPRYINTEVTFKDPTGGTNRTIKGQLWFKDFPILDARRGTHGFGKLGYYDGIKWFVPRNPGEIWISREDNSATPPSFLLHDHLGEKSIVPAFDRIDVLRTEESVMAKLLDTSATTVSERGGQNTNPEWMDSFDLDGAGSVTERTVTTADLPADAPKKKKGEPGAAPSEAPTPLRLGTDTDIGVTRIPLIDLVKIVFLDASDGLKRETYTGRFVQYSGVATGDDGRVQVKAATYFGGPDPSERFVYGDFLKDGTIFLTGNFIDLSFVDPAKITVLGSDPAADAYPNYTVTDPKGRETTVEPRRTATLAFFSPDLTRLLSVVRLPWGAGTVSSVMVGSDDMTYITGQVGPHFNEFTRNLRQTATVDNAAAVEEAQKRNRDPGPDAFVLKFHRERGQILWIARFKHARLDIFLRPDGKLLTRRGNDLFFLSADGAVENGPKLDITGSNTAVDPRSGAMYFGGSYRSGTGLEPYVNPYLYRVNPDGRLAWTAYGWSGPIVGVEQQRLVADSSVTRIKVGEDGSLTLTGWSDGGNTVLSCQPYDMRQTAPSGGFASEVWGARGGLTVRIAHMIHMNSETMEVDHCSKYVAYLPTSDVPTLLNIYDIQGLPNGDVALTGSANTGLIETHDAWTLPWYVEYQTNEFAQARSGTFFTLFKPDFSRPRMSTRTPGVGGGQLAARGNLLLLYSSATGNARPASESRYGSWYPTIIRQAIQPVNGGGTDAYAMLIDTQAPPNPPVIAVKNWGTTEKKKGPRP
jgi:hypothetical protein